MILSDSKILEEMAKGNIVIEPFDRKCLGSNSYDVHLGDTLFCYSQLNCIDAAKDNPGHFLHIPSHGFELAPRRLYLASTLEYTETRDFVPYVDGKSSVGRLGVFIHATAGRGDSGFCNHWTLEMSVVEPVRIYAGMPIGQLTYHAMLGEVLEPYDKKASAKYNGRNPLPMPSAMYKNFAQCPECRNLESQHLVEPGVIRCPSTCETCGKVVREGLRFCPGLSPCWRAGMGVV